MVEMPVTLIYEANSFIVAMSSTKVHLAAYTILDNIYWIAETLIQGTAIFSRTRLNISIATNDIRRYSKTLKKVSVANTLTGSFTVVMVLMFMSLLFWLDFFGNSELEHVLQKMQIYLYLLTFVVIYDRLLQIMTKSMDKVVLLSTSNFLWELTTLGSSYLVSVSLGMELEGVLLVNLLSIVIRPSYLYLYYCFMLDKEHQIQLINKRARLDDERPMHRELITDTGDTERDTYRSLALKTERKSSVNTHRTDVSKDI